MFGLVPHRRRGMVPRDWAGFSSLPRVFQEFFDGSFDGFKVDIKEDDNAYLIQAEIPGAAKDAIDIELQDRYLTIRVKNDQENEEKSDNYIHRERCFSSCQRSFFVGYVKQEDIKASYNDGILEIAVPKERAQAPNTRRIDIH